MKVTRVLLPSARPSPVGVKAVRVTGRRCRARSPLPVPDLRGSREVNLAVEIPALRVYQAERMPADISLTDSIEAEEVLRLYRANAWSSAEKPDALLAALENSHSLATARLGGELVGLANVISDGHLVAYFPHLLVHPEHQRRGIGRQLMVALLSRYRGFHQLLLTADGEAVRFYEAMGFERAGKTVPLWIYEGTEH